MAWLGSRRHLPGEAYQDMRAKYTLLPPKPPENPRAAPAPSGSAVASKLGRGHWQNSRGRLPVIAGNALRVFGASAQSSAISKSKTAPCPACAWLPVLAGMRLPVA